MLLNVLIVGNVEYEVRLGINENTESCLRHSARNEHVACHTGAILDCTETRFVFIRGFYFDPL